MGYKVIYHSKPTIGMEEEEAVLEVIRSGLLAQGPKVLEFENLVASYIGKKYAIAVSSGLAALHLSLIGLNIDEGDEVILPSYTCDALLQAVLYVRAKPVIVDVNYEDGNIYFDNTLRVISDRTKAIIIPHTFGFPADLNNFLNLNIPIIEDCAVAIGGSYKGRKLGSFGEVSVFSFYATKMIATGEGGMILTDDEKIADKVRDMRDYTKHTTFKTRYNYKMTDIEAALGICQIKKLSQFIEKRKVLFDRYIELLKDRDDIVLPYYNYEESTVPSFYRFIIKLPRHSMDSIIEAMRNRGIICGRGVLQPLHRLLGFNSAIYPNSERLSKEVISLPLYPSLEIAKIDFVVESLLETLGRIGS